MSTTKSVLVKVDLADLKPGKTVFTSPTDSNKYLVLDVGHPFILLENLDTHWAGLYHPVDPLYAYAEVAVDDKTPVESTPSKFDESNLEKTE